MNANRTATACDTSTVRSATMKDHVRQFVYILPIRRKEGIGVDTRSVAKCDDVAEDELVRRFRDVMVRRIWHGTRLLGTCFEVGRAEVVEISLLACRMSSS